MSVRSARKSSRGCCSLFLWPFIILMVLGVFWNSSHKAESTRQDVTPSTSSVSVNDDRTQTTQKHTEEQKLSQTSEDTKLQEIESSEPQTTVSKVSETQAVTVSETHPTQADSARSSFDLPSVSEYSGAPSTTVNGDMPYFSDSDLTATSYKSFGNLDRLGRCTAAMACIGPDLLPTAPRGQIGMVKPTGWHLAKYAGIDGNYLYNRCHLIAYELSGENANEKNLITGTRYLNIEGMLPYENKVADYVKYTGNHVMYRVTPIFEGDNLLASGVLMEGESVEDGGNGIKFCIYAYNVQPGITIDYATGDSSGSEYTGSETAKYDGVNFFSPSVIAAVQQALNDAGYDCGTADGVAESRTNSAIESYRHDKGLFGQGIDAALAMALGLKAYDLLSNQNEPVRTNSENISAEEGSFSQNADSSQQNSNSGSNVSDGSSAADDSITYVVNTNTGKFHYPDCPSVSTIADHNRMDSTETRDQLIAEGYQPCKRCNP